MKAINEIAISKEAAEMLKKAMARYIVDELDKGTYTTEEDELAFELYHTFRNMYKEGGSK